MFFCEVLSFALLGVFIVIIIINFIILLHGGLDIDITRTWGKERVGGGGEGVKSNKKVQ